MMYIVGQAYDPDTNEDASCWSIEIHTVSDTDPNDILHLGCIEIHADSMDLCVLKARVICDVLNDKGFRGAEMMVEKLCATKGQHPAF